MTAIARAELIRQLSGMVGEARALELVAQAAEAVGAPPDGDEGVARIVDHLTEIKGAVGAHVRLLRSRSRQSQTRMQAVTGGAAPPETPGESGPRSALPHRNLTKLVELMSSGVGVVRAADLVGQRVVGLGLDGARLSRAEAFAILESLAKEEGVVGLAASFAKVRAHLELTD